MLLLKRLVPWKFLYGHIIKKKNVSNIDKPTEWKNLISVLPLAFNEFFVVLPTANFPNLNHARQFMSNIFTIRKILAQHITIQAR